MSAFSMAHAEPAYYLPTAEHRRLEVLEREREAAASDVDMTGTCER